MDFLSFWKFNGKVDRKTYAIVGLVAFFLKENLDRVVAGIYFHRAWNVFHYWVPLNSNASIRSLPEDDARFIATMVALALPFIWLGVAMTVRRLRDIGEPVWLVVLFFIPYINLLLFAVLCLLPTREEPVHTESAPWPGPRALDGLIPKSKLGSAILSIVLSSVIGLSFVLLGVLVTGAYGWSLFVALPFCLGLFSVLLYSYHAPRGFAECVGVSLLPVVILGGLLLLVAIEGLICIMMAAPIAGALALLGGLLGYRIQANHWRPPEAPVMLSVVLLLVPAFFGMERAAGLEPETYRVQTAIEVNTRPGQVWQKVIAFAEIPPPKEMLFRAGIAYPIRAEISGHGVGAVRHCIFSTGPFVEPIEIWDEPRLLKFGVTANPAPLQEWTPYAHIEPPHLHGYFVSEQGQFLLTALPGGRTRLEGTTWYRHTMWPAAYWRLWSDYIIHRIHLRVLDHIKLEAESSGAGG
jgi:uncharacterized membrane protein YhaH (DUF805 family)